MSTRNGWISYAPGSKADLPKSVRREVEERRGGLLAIVQVGVYEHDEEAQVSFPPDAMLGPDAASAAIADVLSRAHRKLGSWRA